MTGGRPLRALAVLAALLAGWLVGRWPAMTDEVRRLAELGTARAPRVVADAPPTGLAAAQIPDPVPARIVPVAYAVHAAAAPMPPGATARERVRAASIAPARRADVTVVVAGATSLATTAPDGVASLPVAPAAPAAFDLATRAYAEAAHDRRAAVRDFAAAVAAAPDAPRAGAWAAAARRLSRRWSAAAYTVVRASGDAGPGVSPLLGGGQSGAAVAFTPDPLAARPLAVTARLTAANDTVASGAEAAIGLRLPLAPGVSISAERLVAVGRSGRDAWTARLAAGREWRASRWTADAYGEAGVVTTRAVTGYSAAAAHARYRAAATPALTLEAGGGVWASIEHARADVDRVDIGPGIRLRTARLPVEAAIDYRFRVAGNARPGSGPVLTMTAGF